MHVLRFLLLMTITASVALADAADLVNADVKSDDALASPFKIACHDPKSFAERPKTGLFRRAIPFFDGHGRSTVDFLNRIGKNILAAMSIEAKDLSLRTNCLRGKSDDEHGAGECSRPQSWYRNELVPLTRAARMNLALSQTNENLIEESQYLRKSSVAMALNRSLDPLGTVKITGWEPLTKEEISKAELILKEYQTESRNFAQQEVAAGRLPRAELETAVAKSIYLAKLTHGRIYIELLARNPVLQYLATPLTSKEEAARALGKMQAHLKSDVVYVETSVAAANSKLNESRGRRDGVMPPEPRTSVSPAALRILDYKSFVEDELLREPADCGIAISLLETKENRELGTSLVIGVPLVVATVALPIVGEILAGSVLATASGTGYALSAKADKDRATDRFLSKLNRTDATEYLALDQANQDFEIAIGLGVASLGAGPAVRAGVKTAQFGSKLAAKSARRIFKSFQPVEN